MDDQNLNQQSTANYGFTPPASGLPTVVPDGSPISQPMAPATPVEPTTSVAPAAPFEPPTSVTPTTPEPLSVAPAESISPNIPAPAPVVSAEPVIPETPANLPPLVDPMADSPTGEGGGGK